VWIVVTKFLPENRNNFGHSHSLPSSWNKRLELFIELYLYLALLSYLGDLEVIWGRELYECRSDRQLPIPQVGKESNDVLATFLSGMIRKMRMRANGL